jgi:hypothetical protein
MSAFKEYATGTAFAISLSKPQIECLCQIHQTGGSWRLLTTSYALQRKGLVIREFDGSWHMRLTDAGEALMPLLKLAGLWVDFTTPAAMPIQPVVVRAKGSA